MAPDRPDSAQRRALGAYTILDTPSDAVFDRLVRMAARFLDMPIATLAFIDQDRIWYKATYGTAIEEHAADVSFCAETARRGELFTINDPQQHEQFTGHPLLEGDAPVRFYAGAPLMVEGPLDMHAPVAVGALGILDTEPRELSPEAIETLQDLAAMAVDELDLRATKRRATDVLESITDAFFALDDQWRFTYLNSQAEVLLERSRADLLGRNVWEEFPDARDSPFQRQYEKAVRENTTVQFEAFYEPLDTWFSVRAYPHADGLSVYFVDVTERRNMEETLRERERRFRLLFQNNPLPMWVYDRETLRFLAVNGAAIDQYGYSEDEFLEMRITDIRPEEELPRLMDNLSGNRPELEHAGLWTHQRRDGRVIDVEITSHTLDFDGQDAVLVVAQDVTERVEAERALREREELLTSINNHISEGIYRSTPEDGLVYVNEAFVELFGYADKAELLNMADLSQLYAHPEERDRFVSKVHEEGSFQHEEVEFRRADGSTFWGLLSATTSFDEGGNVLHRDGSILDITARKQAERALQKREKYLSVTLDSIGDAVIATGVDGRVTRMNAIAEILTGWPEEEARDRPLSDIFIIQNAQTAEPVENPVDVVLHEGKTVGLANHTKLIARDGTERQIADSAAPIRTEDGDLLGVVLVFRNVTEQYERRQALRESKLALEQAQKISQTGTIILDVATDTIELSNEAGRLLGLDPDQPHPVEAFRSLTHPDDQPAIQEAAAQVRQSETPYDIEFRMTPSGRDEVRWIRGRGQPLTDEQGAITKVFGTLSDITERKERESTIQRFGRLLDASVNEIYLCDADSMQFVQVNRGARENLGYSEEELLSMTPLDFTPFTRAELKSMIEPLRTGEEELTTLETTHRRKDGSTYPVEVHLQLSHHESPPLLIGVALDITERKAAEEALRQSEKRYRTLVEQSHDAIYIYRGTELLFVNQRTCELTGYSEEELLNMNVMHLVHPDDREQVREYARQRREGEAPNRYEARLMRPDGTVRHGEFSVQAITYQGEYAAIGSIRDITERKEAEEMLRAAKEEAEEMNRLKSAFLANMSHEIRTPLTSIIGFTEVLDRQDLGQGDRFIELIRRGGERLLETLNSVLDLSQLEAGSMQLSPALIDVIDEVRDTADLFRPRAAKQDVDLQLDVPEAPLQARLDSAALRRILNNLLSNAIKFTEPGDTITTRITPGDETFQLEVEDTGVGIDAEFIPHLFDAFRQESVGDARAYEGSGLGLTITHQLTEMMGGSIDVESAKGEGTRFTVTLPRQMDD